MNKFGSKLMTDIIPPILSRKVSGFDVYDDGEHFLEIGFDQPASGSPDPLNVLDSLSRLFTFLGDSYDFPISESESEKTFMEFLGEIFGTRVVELLIKECLSPAVPSYKEDLEDYNYVIEVCNS